MNTLPTPLRGFSALWQQWTQLSVDVPDPEAQRQAVLIVSIVLALLLVLLPPAFFLTLLLVAPPNKLLMLGGLAVSAVVLYALYQVGRRGHTWQVGQLLSWYFTLLILVVALLGGGRFGLGVLHYMILPLLFTSLFQPQRLSVWMMIIHLSSLLIAPLVQPSLVAAEVIGGPVSFYLLVSIVLALAAYYRHWLEQERARAQRAERAQSEERLRNLAAELEKQSNIFNQLLSSTDDVLIIHDREGHYLYVNAAGLKNSGLSAEQVIGKTWRELGFPESTGIRFDEQRARVFDTGQPVRYESIFPTCEGERFFDTTLSPMRAPDGTMTHVVNTIRDVTARKKMELALRESEERYRIISELISDYAFSCRVDEDGEPAVEWMTGSYTTITGYQVGESPAFAAYHPEDIEQARADVRRVLAGEEVRSEYRIQHKNGTSHWIFMTRRPIKDETGRVIRFYGVAQDITARKAAETERLRLSMQSDRLALARQFMSAISHDFRTALANIETSRYLIQRSLPQVEPERIQSRLDVIQEAVSHLAEQLNSLSTITALTSGSTEPCSLDLLVHTVVTDAKFTAYHLGVDLTASLDQRLPPVLADCEEVRGAIKHLLTNALKHTQPGGSVRVRTYYGDGEARVEVADTGSGIAPEHLPHIFDLFYRADSARNVSSGGVGLGLSIVRMVADAHGGRVWVESKPGEGSVFTLALPIHINETIPD